MDDIWLGCQLTNGVTHLFQVTALAFGISYLISYVVLFSILTRKQTQSVPISTTIVRGVGFGAAFGVPISIMYLILLLVAYNTVYPISIFTICVAILILIKMRGSQKTLLFGFHLLLVLSSCMQAFHQSSL